MIILTKEQIKILHSLCVEKTGGSFGIRDEGLLDSAISSVMQSFGGVELYSTLQEKAAQLCFSIVNNHAFIDGNKRIGVLAMLTMLELNGIELDVSDEEIVGVGMAVAQGEMNAEDITKWIISATK